jgi:hypothetical protein
MLTKAVGSGDAGSRIVEALQLAPQQRDLRLLIRINRDGLQSGREDAGVDGSVRRTELALKIAISVV